MKVVLQLTDEDKKRLVNHIKDLLIDINDIACRHAINSLLIRTIRDELLMETVVKMMTTLIEVSSQEAEDLIKKAEKKNEAKLQGP